MVPRECFRIVLVLLAVVLAGFAMPARAQELKPLPELGKGFDLAGYAAMTDTVTKEFPNINYAGFQIALPRTWLERVSRGQDFGEIARFDGPAFGDVRPYFSYKRMSIARENTARMELINYVLKKGYVLRSIREIDDRNIEAMYVVLDDKGDSFVVRALMRIMGPDMLMAEYALPADVWSDQVDSQTFAIRSFKFMKESALTIEKRTKRVYFQSLAFYYPASWIFAGEEAPADNQVTVRLASRRDTGIEGGRIVLSVVSPRSLKDASDPQVYIVDMPAILKRLREDYEAKGYDLGKAVENRVPDVNLKTNFATMDVYNVRRKMTSYETDKLAPISQELWLAVFRTEKPEQRTYIVELYTPSREQDLYQWSINTRAFEIILKSIQ